jgi:hypothetical protein
MISNRTAATAATCCALMFVSGCGGGGTSATEVAPGPPATAPAGRGPDGGAGSAARALPGTTGLLAQIAGTTLQVQAADAQTAVTYSAATTFTNTVAARLSDVVAGVCVRVRTAQPATGDGATAPTAAPSPTDGPIAATSVEISAALKGSCSPVGRDRVPDAGANAAPPPGAPSSGRTRGPGAAGRNGFGGFGGFGASSKVTTVNGAGFTVESSRAQGGTATTAVPTTLTVVTSDGTAYTRTGAANAKALAVGLCVTALGKPSDTGEIAATSIALRRAENGACSSGFGGRRPGPASTGGGPGA